MNTRGSDSFADVGQTLANLLCLPQIGEPRESRRGYLSARVVRGVTELLDSSGILNDIDRWRDEDTPADKGAGGRPKLVADRVALILLLALTMTGEPPLVSRVAEAYTTRLQTASRDLLGLPRTTPSGSDDAIYHRVYRAPGRILDVVDPYPGPRRKRLSRADLDKVKASWNPEKVAVRQKRLVHLTNALLEASSRLLPDDVRSAWNGNVCVDATLVRVWGKSGSPVIKNRTDHADDRMSPEYLAGWYTREADHREPETPARGARSSKRSAWGYEAHLAAMTANDPGTDPDFPLLVLGMSLDKPAGRVGENAVTALASIADRGHPTGICASDRAYFPGAKPEKFQLPVRSLGYQLVGDYRNDQLGIQAEHGGALLVEGNWYCPSMPQPLIDATIDYRAKRISEDVYEARISQRSRYLFRPKHKPNANGNTAHMCPARGPGATATCQLAPEPGPVNLGLPTTRTRIATPPEHPDICCTNSTSITFPTAPDPGIKPTPTAAAKYRQDLQYASPIWRTTYATLRNTIEGYNGFTKNTAEEALEEPGRRRVRGYAFQALLIACLITASNLRKIGTYLRKRATDLPPPTTGKATDRSRRRRGSDLADYRPNPNAPPLAMPA